MARQPKRNRRSQDPSMLVTGAPVTPTVTSGGASTIAIALDRPCAIKGVLGSTVATRTFVSQAIVDAQHITQTFSGTITGKAFTVTGNEDTVQASDGGRVKPASGTFS